MPGDDREQHLRGADVARRLLAADVLLARLQREPQRGPAGGVDRDADEAAGQAALVVVAGGDERRRAGRRSRAARRSAGLEPTTTSAPHSPGGASSASASRSAATTTSAPCACSRCDQRAVVADRTAAARVLQEHAEDALGAGHVVLRVAHRPPRCRAARRGCARPRSSAGDSRRRRRRCRRPSALTRRQQRHRLGGRGALVEQRRVGERPCR